MGAAYYFAVHALNNAKPWLDKAERILAVMSTDQDELRAEQHEATMQLIVSEAKAALAHATTSAQIDVVEAEFLGRKGQLTGLVPLLPVEMVKVRRDELSATIDAKRGQL